MFNLSDKNQNASVELAHIVFMQGDDYNTMERELERGDKTLADANVIDYLLQWYDADDDHYMHDNYNADDINTSFLGHIVKVTGYKGFFLFSINRSIGYAGLSKIISFTH